MNDIRIECGDGTFGAYLAMPPGGSGPGVLLAQEIFGVNDVMRAICDGYAAAGYFALCPDLFWRQEPDVRITDRTDAEWTRAFELYEGFDEDRGVDDLVAALGVLRGTDGCTGRVGVVGYCLGGKLAYLMATRADADCAVGYYGVGIEKALDEGTNITRPLLLHLAGKDGFCPPEAQQAILDALAGNALVTVHAHPGVDHAFARRGGAHYDEAAARRADGATAAFLAQSLG